MSQFIYGIDLAKHSFSIHGEDHGGKVLIQSQYHVSSFDIYQYPASHCRDESLWRFISKCILVGI
ncbi:hypothetical protein [Photobacterium salinisoli]|uniref:hypothetical protein n=1 Tax=Photobacterium salinisoli TaxID=1616783 RepID=UPI000EA072BC|nr:hypothetical protein [Photobacterium salinisoli]